MARRHTDGGKLGIFVCSGSAVAPSTRATGVVSKGRMKGIVLAFRVFFTLAAVGFFVWIADQHIPFDGRSDLTYTAGEMHGQITRPHPLDRVRVIKDASARPIEQFIEDPIYFEIKTSVPYQRANFTIRYQNKTDVSFKIGLKDGLEGKVLGLKNVNTVRKDGEWTVGEAEFDLFGVERTKDRYFFILSFPGVQFEHPERGFVLLDEMRVSLSRPSARTSDFLSLFKRKILSL